MIISFIKTKVGISLIVALLFIGGAIVVKIVEGKQGTTDIRDKVSLIASSSVKEASKDGSTNLDEILSAINGTGTTSVSDQIATLKSTSSTTADENITATDRFSRELFTEYMQAKKNGQTIDAATTQNIADSVLANDYSGQTDLITVTDIKTTTDQSRARAQLYGNTVGQIFATPRVPGDQELFILDRIQTSGINDADVKSLNLILQRYNAMRTELANMTVPTGAVAAHTDLVNGFTYIVDAVNGMLTISTDPIGSLTKIKHYEDGMNLLSAGALGLKAYFRSLNIVFSSSESGYGITQ